MSAHIIIDRTLNGKRTSASRQKFIKRVKAKFKDQIHKQIADGNIKDLVEGGGRKVNVPKKDLGRPTFTHGKGGKKEGVHPGNKEFQQGDRIPRPPTGEGKGKGASDSKETGEDAFQFTLTHEEFLDIFFEDCELPNLQDTTIIKTDKFDMKRAGFSVDGPAAMLNIERTMRTSKGRRIGLHRKGKKQKLTELEEKEIDLLNKLTAAETEGNEKRVIALKGHLTRLRKEIIVLRRKLKAVPFIDDVDLRYNRWEKVPVPTSQAVMFNIMDVSGSMTEWDKRMSKSFFMLLYLFLTRNYERVDVVWIHHHTTAKEVDEEEFFKSREMGGTLVSTALALQAEIMQERYSPTEWNVYICQASDGDNWSEDNPIAIDYLKDLLPELRYMAYIEVDKNHSRSSKSDLWEVYENLAKVFPHFQMRKVGNATEIYPVFKELFKKR